MPDSEQGRRRSLDHTDTLILTAQTPDLREIHCYCLQATQVMMFWYRSPNRLRQTERLEFCSHKLRTARSQQEFGRSEERFSPRTFRFQTAGPHFCCFQLPSWWKSVMDGWIDRYIHTGLAKKFIWVFP